MSVLADGEIASLRAVGNLSKLREAVLLRDGALPEPDAVPVATIARPATSGIGHTRWATHGRVTESNAHPHFDTSDRVRDVVVNGIVENHLVLKERLNAPVPVGTSRSRMSPHARALWRGEPSQSAVSGGAQRLVASLQNGACWRIGTNSVGWSPSGPACAAASEEHAAGRRGAPAPRVAG